MAYSRARGHRAAAAVVALATAVSLLTPAAAPAATSDRANIVVTYRGFPEAAKTAFEFAVVRWESMLSSPVPIKVRVRWTPLPGTYALGHAGPVAVTGTDGAKPNRFYPLALANALAGSDQRAAFGPDATYDITGEFNSSLPNWYFGTDGKTPAGRVNFVTVVMHELGHGLGVSGWMRKDGATGTWGSTAGIFDEYSEAESGKRLLNFTKGSVRLGNQLTSGALYWGGRRGVAYNGGERPRLYAPAVWVQGTSYSHLNERTYRRSGRNALMTPVTLAGEDSAGPGPIVLGMLRDMGWRLGPAGQNLVARLTLLSSRVSDASVSAGTDVRVRGVLRLAESGAAVAGRNVKLYKRRVGTSTWKFVATDVTSATGVAEFVVRPTADTRYQLRHAGSSTTDADRSPDRTVRVG